MHSGCGTGATERQRGLVDRHFLAEVTKAVSDRCRMVPDWASLRAHVSDSLAEDFAQGCRMAEEVQTRAKGMGYCYAGAFLPTALETQAMLKRLAIRKERKRVWSP